MTSLLHKRQRPPVRRGMALMDAIIGGIILGIGLAVTLSIASQALSMQAQGQKQITAAWLLDEQLAMVLVEGPVAYPQLYPSGGRFETPFDDYEYQIDIDDIGLGQPFQVTAAVRWPHAGGMREIVAQTFIAERKGDPLEIRAPLEPIDRIARYYDEEE